MVKELEEKTIEELKFDIEIPEEEPDIFEEETPEEKIENLNLYLRFNSNIPPVIAAGAGAGTTPTVSLTNSTAYSSNDTKGQVNVTTGTATPTGLVCTVTFARNYDTPPIVTLTPANAATAAIMVSSQIVAASTVTTFTITSTSAALANSTAYSWFYHCLE